MKKAALGLCFFFLFASWSYAMIQFQGWSIPHLLYVSDSMWVGAGAIARHGDSEIVVTSRDTCFGPVVDAEIYYLVPGYVDTPKFVFHSLLDRHPNDSAKVNIGKYPKGTPIIFMFTSIDTTHEFETLLGIKKYSGQNRDSIDLFVTEVGNTLYGHKYEIAGRYDENNVEMSFMGEAGWGTVNFFVSNVFLEGLERNNVAIPRASVKGEGKVFVEPVILGLHVPEEGLKTHIYITNIIKDTLDPIQSGAVLKIFYTLDGSDPRISPTRQLYNDSISITETTTLKAYAELDGDTLWFPSPVITEQYVFNNTPIRFSFSGKRDVNKNVGIEKLYIYNLMGRKMAMAGAVRSMRSRGAAGYYVVKANNHPKDVMLLNRVIKKE